MELGVTDTGVTGSGSSVMGDVGLSSCGGADVLLLL